MKYRHWMAVALLMFMSACASKSYGPYDYQELAVDRTSIFMKPNRRVWMLVKEYDQVRTETSGYQA